MLTSVGKGFVRSSKDGRLGDGRQFDSENSTVAEVSIPLRALPSRPRANHRECRGERECMVGRKESSA